MIASSPLDTIPSFLDRRPTRPLIYTYSILNAYLNCPEAMQRRYIKKDLGPYVQSKEAKWGDEVHKAFEDRIRSGKHLPASMEQWEQFAAPFDGLSAIAERQLGIAQNLTPSSYCDPPVYFRGKVDVSIVKDDTAYIVDWKSGNSKYEHPLEIATNAVLVKVHHPHLRVIKGSYAWLAENRMSEVYDLSDVKATWGRMREIIAQIEQDRQLGEWHKKKSGLCGWCAVKDCEHHP